MRKISTTSELPTTRPDGPGFYREDLEGRPIVWLSWWNPSWPPASQPEGSYRSPQDRLQLTVPQGDGQEPNENWAPWLAAVQGVRLLGAHETQNAGYRAMLAFRFLDMQKQKREPDPLASDDRVLQRLINALQKHGRELRERLSALPCAVTFLDPDFVQVRAREVPDFHGPPHSLGTSYLPGEADEVLAAMLEHLGEKGRDLARRVRGESKDALSRYQAGEIGDEEVWQPWFPTVDGRPPARHAALVQAVWHDVVRHGLGKPPALPRAVHAPVLALLSSPLEYDASRGRHELGEGKGLARVVHVDAMAAPYLARGVGLFQRIITHYVLRHFVFEAHRRALANVMFPQSLHYPGGYAALASACGIEGRKGADELRHIVEAMACLDVPLGPGHTGQLFSREFSEARGRQQAYLTITVGSPLLPNYVHELKRRAGKGLDDRRAQDLIPLLPIPPTIGRPNDKGAQATLSLRIVSHLRDHAPELLTHGGAPLPLSRFKELAEQSQLSATMAPRVLEHWQCDHRDGPAFLKRTSPDRYTLGDAHLAERLFLEEGGQRSLDGRVGGLQSARKRALARRGQGSR